MPAVCLWLPCDGPHCLEGNKSGDPEFRCLLNERVEAGWVLEKTDREGCTERRFVEPRVMGGHDSEKCMLLNCVDCGVVGISSPVNNPDGVAGSFSHDTND